MLSGQGSRKAIAATLLLLLLNQTFAPSISYALTAGPTQPEATSFEPVDTTDMVNLQTGGFTYNVPLMEVPGPEGGYPLSLAYHAGIMPNVDASWVGLGWSLNPGAISRNVNGYPDDWNNPKTTSHFYWAGGQTVSYSVGVSVGIAGGASVGANLTFAHDTYRGFGIGADLSLSFGLNSSLNAHASATVGVGVSPYGDAYAYGGVGLSIKLNDHFRASMGLSVTTNFKSMEGGFSAGIDYGVGSDPSSQRHGSLLGISLSTGGNKPSLSVGGLTSSISNSKAGNISTSSHGFHFDIPVLPLVSLSLGYSKVRYWSNETTSVTTWGSLTSLENGNTANNNLAPDNNAYDEYSLLESPSSKNIVYYPDPTTVQGGSFPDFDKYDVESQGLGGSMRPFLFQGEIMNQNIYNGSTPLVQYYAPRWPTHANAPPFFRFENDFSNSYRQTENGYSDPSLNMRLIQPPIDGAPVYGNNDGNAGFGLGSNLAGSRHVDIGPKIFPRQPLGYTKTDKYLNGMIEGFSITNESGVTYHFGLPAYSSNEENYQEKIDQSSGATGNRITKATPYAYTWYLTTITGPDYVDRNGNGIADDGDWGYWVDFEYGKWSNHYNWRNPSQGFNADEDNAWNNVSMGTREVYYLNAIRTRTHIALFEKDIRNDAKGGSPENFNKNYVNPLGDAGYTNQGVYNNNSSQSLKLSHIYILNASDENFVTPSSGSSVAYQPTGIRPYPCTDCELAGNVLDRTDVDAAGRAALEAKAIRVIDFNYDYSLCPGTTNSFDINNPTALTGKLSLLSFVSRGKGGANLTPPISFGYDLAASKVVTQSGVTLSPGNFVTTNGNFNIGDLIMESGSPATYCGVITGKTTTNPYTYTLANGNYTGGAITATVYTTKNPPYNKDAYDGWQMYKSDYSPAMLSTNQNLGRLTTPCSSAATDVWSLRTITTQLGDQININYESSQIGNSVLATPYPFIITSPALDAGLFNAITFTVNTGGYPLSSVVAVGNTGQIVAQIRYHGCDPNDNTNCADWDEPLSSNYTVTAVDPNGTVHATLSTPILSIDPTIHAYNLYYSFIATGNISGNLAQVYGGGIRVNNLSTAGSDGLVSSTSYNYNIPSTNTSSGVTSFMPAILDIYDKGAVSIMIGADQDYRALLYAKVSALYSLARELPPPGVIYQYVTVTNQVKNPDEPNTRTIEGSTQYQFEVFNGNMVGIEDVTPRTGPITAGGWSAVFTRNLALNKFTSAIGNVRRVVQFDASGRKLTETINHYLHDNLAGLADSPFVAQYKTLLGQQFNYQGYLEERYAEVKEVLNKAAVYNGLKSTLSARETYPCIRTGQTVINYVNGTQTSSTNLAFDFYSGAVTQTLETDAYGNNTITQTVPAYRKYAGMGLKINNDNNKNMLTQTAETYKWQVDSSNNKTGLITASATTWSDALSVIDINGTAYTQNSIGITGDVWRTQSTYNYLSSVQTADGTTPFAGFSDFNFATPSSSDPNWKNTSTITLYDVYSKALEAKDVDNNYSASHLNYGDQKVILSGNPANFYEIAYSGAEDAAINQTANIFVKAADGTIASTAGAAHTGAQSLLLGVSGKRGFLYSVPTNNLTAGRTYQASVWVKPTSGSTSTVGLYYDIDGTIKNSSSSAISTKTANGWTLVNLVINGSDITAGHTLNVYCRNDNATIQAYADDFRFQPINATTTAYVYDPFSGELSYILDNSNIYTQYIYDGTGRLVSTYNEKLGTGVFKTNQYQYNYSTGQYQSAAINTTYAKNNCPAFQNPSSVAVSLPAGYYSSFISQIDADANAQIYAHDYVNTHGTCTCAATFTYSAGISSTVGTVSLSGTTVNYVWVFGWPTGATSVNVGNINGSCAIPSSTRTIKVTLGNAVYNIVVSATGNVQIQFVSGTAPVGNVGFSGSYDLNQNAFYSDPASGAYNRSCPAGQTGSSVLYSVPAYKYSSLVSLIAADQLAQNDVTANGQNYANANGTCTVNCGFNWNAGFNSTSATIGSSGTSGSFSLSFNPNTGSFSNGTLGTITGGCLPSITRIVTVPDIAHSGRQWTVTITSTGLVSVSLASGLAATNTPPPVVISGNYAL